VGAGAIAAGAVSEAGTCFGFFPQPATVIKATRRTTGTRIRLSRFNGLLLWGIKFVLLNDSAPNLSAHAPKGFGNVNIIVQKTAKFHAASLAA
jgi:hypothetical protein